MGSWGSGWRGGLGVCVSVSVCRGVGGAGVPALVETLMLIDPWEGGVDTGV